jgi:hypothetical protein
MKKITIVILCKTKISVKPHPLSFQKVLRRTKDYIETIASQLKCDIDSVPKIDLEWVAEIDTMEDFLNLVRNLKDEHGEKINVSDINFDYLAWEDVEVTIE